ncbi:ligand-binding sensor domain-containing protein [Moheibacter sediminis]|uniref:Two component regulator propeller n=1 Tax=Moheibacter sediminis TaxID=1434700 RepID=A0A1W1Z1R9_9FLAO|nr:two-component regulator propeller domain-containing protein [Moheibacter sediminis]SMC42334.1 Two component regulator propeller [Moheibacter sediminis]
MRKLTFKNPVFFLLLVSTFFISCNGQTQTQQPDKVVIDRLSFTSKNIKLTKTQGTDIYQNVHCSLQDKDGNLWFGTTGEGVYRYDGKEFTQFTEEDGLSNNKVWSILEDSLGNIWFGTDDGISRYDGKIISKIPFTITSLNGLEIATSQSGKNEVWSMMQDKSGTIWFGTSLDLYCYDGRSFSRFLDKIGIANHQNLQLKWIQCLLEDNNGTIWIGSGPIAEEGIIRYDGKSITSTKPNNDGWIRYMLEDKNGHIWFSGRHNGVFRYDGQEFKMFTEKTNIGSAIFRDKIGNIWFDGGEKINSIESIDGLWRYDGKTFENFTTKDDMSKNSVWNMLEDRNGNLWIGTRNCGLFRYDGKRFENFSE